MIKLTEKTYSNLFFCFLGLIVLLFLLLYGYNSARIELVNEAESKGYICEKNMFGFYKKCYSGEYYIENNVTLTNWSEEIRIAKISQEELNNE